MSYDKSISRNRKSRRTLDAIQSLPASPSAGVPRGAQPGTGELQARPCSSGSIQDAVDLLAEIAGSNDSVYLRRLVDDADQPVTVRNAAQRRLRILVKTKSHR
jgi:hypothetical protein